MILLITHKTITTGRSCITAPRNLKFRGTEKKGFLIPSYPPAKKSGLKIVVRFSKTQIEDRPTRIDFSSGANIRYTYSSGGGLQTITYHSTSGGAPTKTMQYVGELVFENGVLTDINHEFGRVLANNGFKYQYYLTDHLGSTRVVLQDDPEVFTTSAGFEPDSMEEESMQFIGYEEAVRISADMLNHTPGEESSFAMRLSGGYGENVGLAKSISVPDPLRFSGQGMPGDTVRIGPSVKKQSSGLF